jgi:mitogen-activated protein kinase 1/3
MELGDADLKSLIKKDVQLEGLQVKFVLYYLLVGLKYLHSAGIYHRDLKPSNVLVNQDCLVKICDFGLARAVGEEEHDEEQQPSDRANRVMTQHVATRFYRAPELILLEEHYTGAIDMWSVGCILAELAQMLEPWPAKDRSPLFPGSTCFPLSPDGRHKHDGLFHSRGCQEQLNVIFDVLGTPSEEEIASVTREDARQYIRCFQYRKGLSISSRLPSAPPDMVDAIQQLLRFSPHERATVEEALDHPLLADIRAPATEVTAPEYITLEFDQEPDLDEQQLRHCFLEEIRSFRRAAATARGSRAG